MKYGKKIWASMLVFILVMTAMINNFPVSFGSVAEVEAATVTNTGGVYNDPTIEVAVDSSYTVGDTVEVNIMVYNNPGVTAMGFNVIYDEKMLEPILGTDIYGDEYLIEYNDSDLTEGIGTIAAGLTNQPEDLNCSSPITVNWNQAKKDVTDEDYLYVTIQFKAIQVGETEIQLDLAGIGINNVDKKSIEFDTADASITVYDTIDSVALTGFVTTPSKGATDASSVSGDNVDAVVSWSPALTNGTFAASTTYTATVTVSADEYYSFASGASVTLDGFTFEQDGDNYVATKTYDATLDKEITEIEITTQPSVTTYTHGESFNTTGMVVKATYDDGTVDTNYTGYTVEYVSGSSLVKGNTSVTISAGGKSATVSDLKVNGLTATTSLFTFDAPSLTYSGSNQISAITDASTVSETEETRGAVTYTVKLGDTTVKEAINCGTYDVYASLAGGSVYDAMDSIKIGSVTIAKQSIAADDFTIDTSDQEYTGSTITPTVSSTTLGSGDYIVEYGTNTDAGTGTITITGQGNYEGTVVETFTIKPITLTSGMLNFSEAVISKTYDGSNICNIGNVKIISGPLAGTIIAGTAVYDSAYVGTDKIVTFTPTSITTGNYVISSDETKELTSAEIQAFTEVTDATEYTTELNPAKVVKGEGTFPSVVFDGISNDYVTEYATGEVTYTYEGATKTYGEIKEILSGLDEGTKAEIGYIFSGTGNYAGATGSGTIYVEIVDITFTVNDAVASESNAVTEKSSIVYGDDWSDIITISDNIVASVIADTDDDTGVYTINKTGVADVGTQEYNVVYTGTINGIEYKNVTVFTGSVEVAKKELTSDDLVYSDTITKEYDGTMDSDDVTVTVKSTSLVKDTDIVSGIAATAVYNSADVATANKVTLTTTSALDGEKYILAAGSQIEVTAIITAQWINIGADDLGDEEYTGEDVVPAITITDAPSDFDADDYNVTYEKNVNAGTATVTISDVSGNNYDFDDVVKEFEITKVSYTGTTKATDNAMYGNSSTFDLATLNLPSGYEFGTISTDDTTNEVLTAISLDGTVISYTFADESANVGEEVVVTIPVTSTDNYNEFNITLTLTVEDKLTQDTFKFTDATLDKKYGDDSFELVIEGNKSTSDVVFESSDDSIVSIEDGVATIHKTGEVTITATTAEDATYLEKTVQQSITVGKKTVVVTAIDQTVLTDTEMPELTYLVTTLAYNDAITSDVVITTNAVDTATAGEYEITVSGLEIENMEYYDIIYTSGTFTVVQEYVITLDANGGTLDETVLTTNVNSKISGLPTPTRNSVYVFEGWYTATEGGEQVTAQTVIENDMTLYAVWSKRDSENSATVDTDLADEIDSLYGVEEYTDEQKAQITDLAEVFVYDMDAETARYNEETLEQIKALDEIFQDANVNLTVEDGDMSYAEGIEEEDKLPETPVEVYGLALSVFGGQEIEEDTLLSLAVQQLQPSEDQEGKLVLSIVPTITVAGTTSVIDNELLQTPVTFKLYVNAEEGDVLDIVHTFTGGGEETFSATVMSDDLGTYVEITVTKFSTFEISFSEEDPEEPTVDPEEPTVDPEEEEGNPLDIPTDDTADSEPEAEEETTVVVPEADDEDEDSSVEVEDEDEEAEDETTTSEVPETGDHASPMLWLTLALIAAGIMLVVARRKSNTFK